MTDDISVVAQDALPPGSCQVNQAILDMILARSTLESSEDAVTLCVDGDVADLLSIDAVTMGIAHGISEATGKELSIRFPKRFRRQS